MIKKATALLYIIIIMSMALATVVERLQGSAFASHYFYGAWWFVALWALLAGCMLLMLWQKRPRPVVLLLHVALVGILAGAFTTYLTSERGTIHLRAGVAQEMYAADEHSTVRHLPFTLTLTDFRIVNHPNSEAPKDYVSTIIVGAASGADGGRKMTVAMNHVGHVGGYRFYQSGYDGDLQGTRLLVAHDPYGMGLTYASYALLLLSLLALCAEKVWRRFAALGILLFAPLSSAHAASGVMERLGENYHQVLAWRVPMMVVVTLGLVVSGVALLRRESRGLRALVNGVKWSLLVFTTFMIALRWLLSRHVPLSNGFETMQFMAWAAIMLTLIVERRLPMFAALGNVVALLALLVATLAFGAPEVAPLAPVLQSPLLALHVVTVMLAYALFAMLALLSAQALCVPSLLAANHAMARRLLLPAVVLLTVGIFLGSVWAGVSWGRYWGWDPKETWALITLMIYAVPLHKTFFPYSARTFHVYLLAAFLAVLMTFFGVNFLLPGLHSYA